MNTPHLDKMLSVRRFCELADACLGTIGPTMSEEDKMRAVANMLAYVYRTGLEDAGRFPGLADKIGRLP